MRARILDFVQALRAGGLEVSLAEAMDAVAAVSAAGVDREVLREALAATLVKDEAERATFDRLFDIAFPLVGADGPGEGPPRRAPAAASPSGGRPGARWRAAACP